MMTTARAAIETAAQRMRCALVKGAEVLGGGTGARRSVGTEAAAKREGTGFVEGTLSVGAKAAGVTRLWASSGSTGVGGKVGGRLRSGSEMGALKSRSVKSSPREGLWGVGGLEEGLGEFWALDGAGGDVVFVVVEGLLLGVGSEGGEVAAGLAKLFDGVGKGGGVVLVLGDEKLGGFFVNLAHDLVHELGVEDATQGARVGAGDGGGGVLLRAVLEVRLGGGGRGGLHGLEVKEEAGLFGDVLGAVHEGLCVGGAVCWLLLGCDGEGDGAGGGVVIQGVQDAGDLLDLFAEGLVHKSGKDGGVVAGGDGVEVAAEFFGHLRRRLEALGAVAFEGVEHDGFEVGGDVGAKRAGGG